MNSKNPSELQNPSELFAFSILNREICTKVFGNLWVFI